MRVISGSARGLKLKTIENDSTRPTKDMVKEALFSIIYDKVTDCVFLDLFAGSGAIGIEALSRGAHKAYFNDINPECIKVIKENLQKAKFEEKSEIFNLKSDMMLDKVKDVSFDIIYIDPPYNSDLGIEAIKTISSYNLLKTSGVLVYETDETEAVPEIIENFEKFKCKKYGRNILNFYSRKE